MINTLSLYLYKLLFSGSIILLILAVSEWFLNYFNYTLSWIPYSPFRLLEFGAIFMLFVIALLLRQIRDILRK
ncbi:MAG: hypothetical protein KAS18_05365 [Calditrichia bacterium]|nr:hypothetical protein [Calditrichia bacterium]